MIVMPEDLPAIQAHVAVILSNLDYVERELPGLDVDEELRQKLLSGCRELRNAVLDLGKEIQSGVVERAKEMIGRQTKALDEMVMGLRDTGSAGRDYVAAEVLLNESGGNILLAYRGIGEVLKRGGLKPPAG